MCEIKTESKVTEFIRRHCLISPGDTVVVGVSGGADSVCLLHILADWRDHPGITLHAAHLDHQLRGPESELDAEYVSDMAHSLGIPITIDRKDVAAYKTERNCSIEEAARELRYDFLATVASDIGAGRIAVGHTRDDHVETVLMHILRGTGISGLSGLAPCLPAADMWHEVLSRAVPGDLSVIRPLLNISREETSDYCRRHRLNPRVDSSNLSLLHFRNRLRLHLLPVLRQYNSGVDWALLRLADIAREERAFIQQQASEVWGDVASEDGDAIHLDKQQIVNLPVALQRQLFRVAVTRLVGDTRDIEASHIEALRNLLGKPVGKRLCLPRGITCQGGYDELVIERPPPAIPGMGQRSWLTSSCPFPPLEGRFPLEVPGETVLAGWRVRATVVRDRLDDGHREPLTPDHSGHESGDGRGSPGAEGELCGTMSAYFDLRETGSELFVRRRRPGDRFQPLGMSMQKKLQEFMVDAKIPRPWRDRIPIVCSAQQIIWVVGWRIDDRVKVTEGSGSIIRLEFIGEP